LSLRLGHVPFTLPPVTLAVSSGVTNVLANLPGHLVGDRLAHLPGHVPACLSGHLNGNLAGNLVALLPGDAVALLLGDAVALLLGNVAALLSWHSVAFLFGDIVADGLGDGPGGVNALGLWDLGAPWAGNQAGLLNRPLVANTLDLGLAPWGSMGNRSNSSGNRVGNKSSIGFGITLAKWVTNTPYSTESSKSSVTSGSNASSNSSATNGGSDNRLNCNLALNSN